MSVGDIDEALDYLYKISQVLWAERKVWAAQHILSLATHLAQVRGYTLSNNSGTFQQNHTAHCSVFIIFLSSQLCISFNIL